MTTVITARLYDRLTPIERMLYSGDDRIVQLLARAYWLTKGEPIDGWDPEDFVGYALELSAVYPDASRQAVSTWMRQEIVRRRTRSERVRWVDLDDADILDIEDPGFTPTRLPEEVVGWLWQHLPAAQAHACQLYADCGLTLTEAASIVGIDRTTLRKALDKLREVMT